MKNIILAFVSVLVLVSCSTNEQQEISTSKAVKTSLDENADFDKYWYNGEAEISSYELQQARYGEMRNGKAVFVFVTEPFSPKNGTKTDQPDKDVVSVLKLNATKNFNTGIYPYSMMTSSFFPVKNGKHSLKISSSSQEWCGHSYMELTNKSNFKIKLASYFEGESFENLSLEKVNLEDDIWSKIRINPFTLPTGKLQMIPSFFYLRLRHQPTKAYECSASLATINGNINEYKIHYSALNRTLTIQFENVFPYKITGWEETYKSGFGADAKTLTTTATLIKTIKSDYWNRNKNTDEFMRNDLGLE